VLKDEQTSSCASSWLSKARTPKQSVALGRVTNPKLQVQLFHVSQLSIVMTKLFYKMNKHRVAYRHSSAQQEHQNCLQLQAE